MFDPGDLIILENKIDALKEEIKILKKAVPVNENLLREKQLELKDTKKTYNYWYNYIIDEADYLY